MKFISKITLLTLLINASLFAQEPQRFDGNDSIINVINASTKGIRYVLNDTGINSELNEVGTSFFKNKYIIMSNKKRRHYETTVNETTNTPNNNLYCVDVKENGDLSFPLLFSSVIDSKDNEGSIAFSPDEKTIFFTQESAEKDGKLELYKATLDLTSDEHWTNITKIDLNTNGYSIETPCVSPDGKKLYFASNMPGGFGNYDLYEVAINSDNTFGTPVNLGENINTSEDEKFPNITADNKHLYFSSKGHLNIGGYDIFRSSIVDNKYLEALNLGSTLNSRRDDLAFVLVSEDKGYLSTDKSQSGNFDILKFEVKHFDKSNPNFTIVEKLSQTVLPNAKVTIKNEFGDIVTQTISDENGKIKMELNPVSYNYITVEKEGYEPFTTNFTSEKLIKSPIELIQSKPEITADAIVIENILFAFNKDAIKAESELSLNKIVTVLNDFPEMNLEISAHTDNKGKDSYNLALSKRRAKSAVDYLLSKCITKERLIHKGYGETKPLFDCKNCTPEQDQANRRVEFKIIKK
jgi:outer membrane protein OmpA-like peptidoglycan-associated protein